MSSFKRFASRLAAATFVATFAVACQLNDSETETGFADSSTAGTRGGGGALKAADFTLKDTSGKTHTLSSYLDQGKTVVLEWFNPDCPYTRGCHVDRRMARTYEEFNGRDVVWLAINSGGAGMQGAGLSRNKEAVVEYDVPYPVLLDETGAVGHAFGAKTTPHMFVVTPARKVIYDGAIDDSGGRGEPKTNYVANVLKAHLAGRQIEVAKTKPYGCSVKYIN